MNTTFEPAEIIPPIKEPKTYLTEGRTLKSWLLTTDHKRIGLLYLYSLLVYFTIAAIAAALMRMELITPAGDMVTSETYNKLFTIHGTLMVWFFLIPSIPAVLGNFVIPMMIGARDVAFPKLNLLSGTFSIPEDCWRSILCCSAAWTPVGRFTRPTAAPTQTPTSSRWQQESSSPASAQS